MLKSLFMLDIKIITPANWADLRAIRLKALQESPQAFLSTFERELSWGRDRWLAEFGRGDWSVGFMAGRAVCLLGATRPPGMPGHHIYLESIWVAPEHRGRGVAGRLLTFTFDRLGAAGIEVVFLHVLDGNDAPMRLYKRASFTSASKPEPLTEYPGRSEQLMERRLRPVAC